MSDKADLEQKLSTARKEIDQLKKRSCDERNNSRKQKDRDQEVIRSLENENLEKDVEKDRIKVLFEEKLREARSKETKADIERKQAVLNANNALERARIAEAGQVALTYELHRRRFEKLREEIQLGVSEAEKNLRRFSSLSLVFRLFRPYSTRADKDAVRKNLMDWKTASEKLEKVIQETKAQYDHATTLILNSQANLCHLDLPVSFRAVGLFD